LNPFAGVKSLSMPNSPSTAKTSAPIGNFDNAAWAPASNPKFSPPTSRNRTLDAGVSRGRISVAGSS
jgi:hypothetical protein